MEQKPNYLRFFSPERFRFIEYVDNEIFQSYLASEVCVMSRVRRHKSKTFIDVGAGYGRAMPYMFLLARDFVLVEKNPAAAEECRRRASIYRNATVIEGDAQNLSTLLNNVPMRNPVIMLLENTLGTIDGDYKKVLPEVKSVSEKYDGEVIISLFRQEALRSWGLKFYRKIRRFCGKPDLKKTDFEKGLFVSKNGYTSKWWSDEEIDDMKKFFGGRVVDEVSDPHYHVMRIEGI